MSSDNSKTRKRYPKRSEIEWKSAAKKISKFVPTIDAIDLRRKLTPGQKRSIRYREKQLRTAYNLFPVSAKAAKELGKDVLYAPGIRAVEFRNVSSTAKIKRVSKGVFLESNGRDWLYQKLPKIKSSTPLAQAAKATFNTPIVDIFDFETIARQAKKAFRNPSVQSVSLWTKQGRADETFDDLKAFMRWLYASFHKYKDTERWMLGIAINIKRVNKKPVPVKELDFDDDDYDYDKLDDYDNEDYGEGDDEDE